MADQRRARGVIDTSVVIDLEHLEPAALPVRLAVSAVTMAELAVGPLTARDELERARRLDRLQRAEVALEPLPFDTAAARAYALVYAAVMSQGRKPRGPRALDLLIAATACAHGLPLYTRNPDDLRGLEDLVEVVAV